MRIILLSGGSGKRLWPLSNDYRSKQFMRVMAAQDPSEDVQTSMIQRVWAKLEEHGLAAYSVIAASKDQQEIIQAQIGHEVPLVLEPSRKDTFPAICLASSFLRSELKVNADEVVVVMPVDVDADDSFFSSIKQLAVQFNDTVGNLGLMGLKPTHPSEKFGYILAGAVHEQSKLLQIDRFVEKPSIEEASALINQGALWNCGVFAFRLQYMLDLLQEGSWPVDYERLLLHYASLPSISFDYQVVEREHSILVYPYDGRWNDLGTWDEWTETMPHRLNGKGILSDDSVNTYIINELQIPVVVMGITDAIVAASPDGILVIDREASPRLKDLVQSISSRPMYEETEYGWYRIIDEENQSESRQVVTKRVHIWAGKWIPYHEHEFRDEIWTFISGTAEVLVNERRFHAKAGDVIHIPSGTKHAIKAIDPINLIEVQIGNPISDSDLRRCDYDWEATK
ncbi:sugar phosphate nucleotidyltransferase [Paenibacillus sp. CF384]|uniref:sugar phosphate nucleotidyltransferase n=1 Tax=Paenibacillus sp. CF384 TaxID=1884382 RepID=UPI000899FC6E|nr:sugar phosphate nucleotidyltransferase [Paenibacillus sp. CF384]SDX31458.1 mannose-1-phosphate guanylyltransferase [Paenibacillus sp. CF384]